MDLTQIAHMVGELTGKIKELDKHFTNHLHAHWVDRLFMGIQTLIIVGMFCFLKWGI